MDNSVVIKGGKNGIVIVLDAEQSFDSIKEKVAAKFRDTAKFLGNCRMAISFEGRELNEDQKEELVKVISENSDLDIAALLDSEMILKKPAPATAVQKPASVKPETVSETLAETRTEEYKTPASRPFLAAFREKQEVFQRKVPEQSTVSAAAHPVENVLSTATFYKMNLRSGQELKCEESIILIGDVNPTAKIISNGNIIILGSLRGDAYAGVSGNTKAFVFALDMNPLQIRIADAIARSSDTPEKDTDKTPKIAFLEKGSIFIETADKNVLNEIKIN